MQSLEAALRPKDPDAKIFFAPKSLQAGGLWLPKLAHAIAEATTFVLLIGEKGIGPWQVIEYYEALDRGSFHHVIRGGSFARGPRLLRAAVRGANPVGAATFILGFRVARTLTP